MLRQHKKIIISNANKVGKILTDKTIGELIKKGVLKDGDESFGALLTLQQLRNRIYPLLDEIRIVADKY